MGFLPSLNKQQKEAVVLLQGGTFLEYFDLMLYVHMAVFLNELFFPKATGFAASLLGAFAFCSTFVFRPFGALLFGYIGDRVGRKHTVTVTSAMMAVTCIIMMLLPTYDSIGMTAAWVVTLCRAVQGISSMGERIGAGIYLTEITPRPARYGAVAWLEVSASVGSMAALGVASLVAAFSYDWRFAFLFGAAIAAVGSVARSKLRETPEFIKNRNKAVKSTPNKSDYKTLMAMFCISCGGPVWFYFVFIYCANVLRDSFGYTSQEIVQSNFIVAMAFVFGNILISQLSFRIYPLKLTKFFIATVSILIAGTPYLLGHATSSWQIVILQILVGGLHVDIFPSSAIYYRHIPSIRRMTFISGGDALAKALMYIIVSFGLIYLNHWFGHWGLWLIMVPVLASFRWAVSHFEKLDAPYKDTADDPMVEEEVAPEMRQAA